MRHCRRPAIFAARFSLLAANIKGHDPRGTRLIVRTVCELFGIGVRHFNRGSERCSNAVSEARFVAAYLLRERFGYSHQAIGAILNRHHSTVMYGAKKVTNDLRLLAIARKAMELLERVDSRSQRMEAA